MRTLAIERSGTISPRLVAHIDLVDRRQIAAIDRVGLHVDLPGAAEQIEVVDVIAAQRRSATR